MPAFSSMRFWDEGGNPDMVDEPAVRVTGTVVRIDGRLASVVVGPELEPWDFPLEMLPDSIEVDSVLVLERDGRSLRFVELDPVAEVARGRPFDLRLRRTARKLPFMRTGSDLP
jgi:hypothetical protein